ncbi:hypothetical protein [Herbidospora mongoliensis]|uniref:hypothetical protein n=1 Tax=Herbidospora mongoliensis TaxID=688067 RepID=UPI00082B0AB6|nr:hypothetical protein [Herbidospora mongoliensis]
MNLDEAARQLYTLSPGEFTAARNRLVKETGDKEIGRLRKPTVLAWAVNQVVRSHPDEVAELLTVGEEMRAAWATGDGDALAALAPRRAAAVSKVSRLALKVASGKLAPAELEQTLDAAVIDADAAAQVRSGRLAGALSYSGFVPTAVPPSSVRPSSARKKQPPAESTERAEAVAAARKRHAEWAGQLGPAVAERDEAIEAVAEAERALTEARKRASAAERRYEVVRREETKARQALDAEQAKGG